MQCDEVYGHCLPGTVEIDPWLQNTLKTQVEVQVSSKTLSDYLAIKFIMWCIFLNMQLQINFPPVLSVSKIHFDKCVSLCEQQFCVNDTLGYVS